MQNFTLFNDYITLGQLLKDLGFISTGGAAKYFLSENTVIYNDKPENRRGKKLYAGDILKIPSEDLILHFSQASPEQILAHQADETEKARVQALVKELNSKNKNGKPTKPKLPFQK